MEYTEGNGKEIKIIYNLLFNFALKADIFRICYVYKEGGLYVDDKIKIDMNIFNEYKKLLGDGRVFFEDCSNNRDGSKRLQNGVFYCEKNDKILENFIGNVKTIFEKMLDRM